jgi:hypothetical protein
LKDAVAQARSTIRRTGRLLTPSTPVISAAKTEAGAAVEVNRILCGHGLPWRLVQGNA